ncbi:MAG: hypothetical protein ABSE58_01810 [Candidatus Limnocylindrales bacterium]|jgi:hypothetical protein
MTDRDKDLGETAETDEELPGEEEFEEEPEEAFEGEFEGEALEGEGPEPSATSVTHRRFTLGRGGGRFEEEAEKRQIGSVRGTHERVHIDDRPSTIYALVCAIGLVGVLFLAWVGGVIPQGAGPTLTPLVVPTSQASASSSAAPSITVGPSGSLAPTASPTAAPSASPS